MKASYEITVKLYIAQELDLPAEILDPHNLAEVACQTICDLVTDHKAVGSYDILSGKVDIK